VIVIPKNRVEWQAMADFLHHYAKSVPHHDSQFIGWVTNDTLRMVIGFDCFLGATAQISVANEPDFHFTPRAILREVFRYAFVTAKREMLLAILSSANKRAMKYDTHLGFRELLRLPGMHENGDDLVVLGMKRSECRYLNQGNPDEQIVRSAARA
jgi:L-amino acid N-acyltransferase YncA